MENKVDLTQLRRLAPMLFFVAYTANGADSDGVIFTEKIQPVLAANCASCHTGASAQAGLSVTSLADLLKGGKRGAAVHPGSSAKSLLLQFIRGEQNPRMPIGGKPLHEETVTALAAAIDSLKPMEQSATIDAHSKWVYSVPSAPSLPAVKNAAWVKNPVDAFILSRLEAKGWSPAPEADKRSLMRRVYFDLVGLPPTVEESSAFLKDTSPDAYEKLVDRLLADKRYGERWGRHWLDLVRFAESDGFAIDGERPTAWRYRDYVIRAFNEDKPYDVFVKEQLAGDEMERCRRSQEASGRK
ncbi:MAG: DUF1549 domain-containing protein [Hymenobacter sp.]